MTPERIVLLCKERPFKAFTLYLTDGSRLRIESLEMISASDNSWEAEVLIPGSGQDDLVDLNHVVRVSIDA